MAIKPALKRQMTKLVKQFVKYTDKRSGVLVNKISVAFLTDGYHIQAIPYWDVDKNECPTYTQKVLEGNLVFLVTWVNTYTDPGKRASTKEKVWGPDKVVYSLSKVVVGYREDNGEEFLKFVNVPFRSDEYTEMWAMLRDKHPALYVIIEPTENPETLLIDATNTQVHNLKKNIVKEVFLGINGEAREDECVLEAERIIMQSPISAVGKLTGFTKLDARDVLTIDMPLGDFLILSGVSNIRTFKESYPDGVKTVLIKTTESHRHVNVEEVLGFKPDFLIIRKLSWVPEHEDRGRVVHGQFVGSHARTQKIVL